jgi:transposase
MAHLYKKVKKGREYYYIRETQRVYGKPATINQVYLGTAEKVQAVFSGEDRKLSEGFSPKEFGSVFVLHELERSINLAAMVDDILPPKRRSRGASLGELLFYAIMNRAIAPKSKRQLASWYETTDIQRIHPCRLESLSSQNFWNHWHRLDEASLEKIADAFFQKVHLLLPPEEKQLLLETAIFYASPGSPEGDGNGGGNGNGGGGDVAERPSRRIGLALLTDRQSGVPVYYQAFSGELTESEFFARHLDNLMNKMSSLGVALQNLTLIFNQGIAPEVVEKIDGRRELHFISVHPPTFLPELQEVPRQDFQPLNCKANRRFMEIGATDEQIRYYETTRSLWNGPRKVIVLYDPQAFPRQYQELHEKLQKVRRELVDLEKKHQRGQAPWDSPAAILARYQETCEELQLNPDLFELDFSEENGARSLSFRLRSRQVEAAMRQFGKTILVTDHKDSPGEEICQAFLDRGTVEAHVQDRKNPATVSLMPQYHWTDSKIRIHIFVCVAALTYLAMLGQKLAAADVTATSKEAMEEMRALTSAIHWLPREEKFRRIITNPNDTQLAVLEALGYQVENGKVQQIRKN